MTDIPFIAKNRAISSKITNPYLNVLYHQLMDIHNTIANCILNRTKISFTDVSMYLNTRNCYEYMVSRPGYDALSSLSTGKKPKNLDIKKSFNRFGLISLNDFHDFDKIMETFATNFNIEFGDLIPENEKRCGPYGLEISITPEEVEVMCKEYYYGDPFSAYSREYIETNILPPLKNAIKSLNEIAGSNISPPNYDDLVDSLNKIIKLEIDKATKEVEDLNRFRVDTTDDKYDSV